MTSATIYDHSAEGALTRATVVLPCGERLEVEFDSMLDRVLLRERACDGEVLEASRALDRESALSLGLALIELSHAGLSGDARLRLVEAGLKGILAPFLSNILPFPGVVPSLDGAS